MKLFFSTNSPFARKCRVVALEKGLEKKIEFINVNPLENPPELLAINPLGTVPAFVTDDGLHLCDSSIICEYLDSLSPTPLLFPNDGSRICILAIAAMANGIMEAAVACVVEGRRAPDKQSPEWRARKEAAVMRAIDKFSKVPMEHSPLSIGTINLAIALAYVNFRLPHLDWRSKYPALVSWLEAFEARPSMMVTRPAT